MGKPGNSPLNFDFGGGGGGRAAPGSMGNRVGSGYPPRTHTPSFNDRTAPGNIKNRAPTSTYDNRYKPNDPPSRKFEFQGNTAGKYNPPYAPKGAAPNYRAPYQRAQEQKANQKFNDSINHNNKYKPTSPAAYNPPGNRGNLGKPLDYRTFSPPAAGGNAPPGMGNDSLSPKAPPGTSNNAGLPTLPPSNFDKHFQDYMDNHYGGEVEPPGTPPPFQGGQDFSGEYLVEFSVSWQNVQQPSSATSIFAAIQPWSSYAFGPIKGFKKGSQFPGAQDTWYLDSKDKIWMFPGGNHTAYYHDGSNQSDKPFAQVIWFSIEKIIPINPPTGFEDKDLGPVFPGTFAPPNTNIPSSLLGLEPGLDLGLEPGLDLGLEPGLDPTQHPATNQPSTFTPPNQKPLPPDVAPPPPNYSPGNDNLNIPSQKGYFDPFGGPSQGYPTGTSTSTNTSTNTSPTQSGFLPGVPNSTKNPFTKQESPVNQPNLEKERLKPNLSTTPPHDCNNPTDPCQAKQKKQLDRIEENSLKNNKPEIAIIQGAIETKRCLEIRDAEPNPNDPDEQNFGYNGLNFFGISEQIKALSKQVEAVRKDFCHVKSELAIPEVWNLKTLPNRPQLVVVFTEVKYVDGKKKLGPSKWSITIPQFNGTKENIQFPDFKKGQIMGILELKDGSKIVINADNEANAKRYVTLCSKYVKKDLLTLPLDIKTVERKGKQMKKVTITPVLAHYYPLGRGLNDKGELKPEWTIQLKTKEND